MFEGASDPDKLIIYPLKKEIIKLPIQAMIKHSCQELVDEREMADDSRSFIIIAVLIKKA
jgi:hypothetical protein